MSDAEVREFLDEERVVIVSTAGPRGWPHSIPLWYTVREGAADADVPADAAATTTAPELWAWTFRASQKVRNLERDPRATLLVEAGDTYDQLRGVMIEARATLHTDPSVCLEFGEELALRYAEGISSINGDARAALTAQAAKRVTIQFHPVRLATWDHRKLGGGY